MPLVPLTTASPKTTTAGVLTLLIGLLGFALQIVRGDFNVEKSIVDLTAVSSGVGLIKAKDNDK